MSPSAETWVAADAPVERVRLDPDDGSWIDVRRGWVRDPGGLFAALRDGVAWLTSRLFRYDHMVEERRLGSFWRSGRGMPVPHPALAEMHRALQRMYKVQFDGFGMMLYRDGRDGQAFHRDTDMKWLDDTVIAIVSLGAQRPWFLRPRTSRYDHSEGRGATHDLEPGSGDLLVMGGRCQAEWEHSVPYLLRGSGGGGAGASPMAVAPRISIQWRHAARKGKPFVGGSYGAPLTYRRK